MSDEKTKRQRPQKYHHKYVLSCGHNSGIVPLPIMYRAQDYIGKRIYCMKCRAEKRVVVVILIDPMYRITNQLDLN